jgi:excisionase family DNA binding protein
MQDGLANPCDASDKMPIHTDLGATEGASVEELLTIDELAIRLKVPKSWIYSHTRRRAQCHLPYIKLGKYLRFSLPDVSAYLEKLRRV